MAWACVTNVRVLFRAGRVVKGWDEARGANHASIQTLIMLGEHKMARTWICNRECSLA
jgi:hypothetical protein